MLQIVLLPFGPGRYRAVLSGRILCTSRQPFFDGARVLLAEGVEPATVYEARHQGSTTVAMRSTVGEAAKWTVTVSAAGGLQKKLWSPFEKGGASDRVPPKIEADEGAGTQRPAA